MPVLRVTDKTMCGISYAINIYQYKNVYNITSARDRPRKEDGLTLSFGSNAPDVKNAQEGKTTIQQTHGISDQQPLFAHPQHDYKDPGSGIGTP